jgi:PASTA domain
VAIAPGDRSVSVGGDVRNSVIVTGDNVTLNVSLDAAEGALLDRLDHPRRFIRWPVPLESRPRRYPNHVDRDAEALAVLSGIEDAEAADVYGEEGIGKSHVLSHVAHRADAATLPDGIVYVPVEDAPLDDVLQALFEEFYDLGSPPARPSRSRLRRELRSWRTLVVVDGLDLDPEEASAVLAAAPGCRFLVASTERLLWDAAPVRLRGLELPYALEVIEQELGRPLTAEERPDAERLCNALAGHPWRIREAVARARDENLSLAEAARRLDPNDTLEALTSGERSVLAVLAAAGGGPVGLAHLRELSAVETVEPVLEDLERRHLVRSHSPRYSLAAALRQEIEARWDLGAPRELALAHYADWAERHRGEDEVADERPALLSLLRWAAAAGRDDDAIRLGRAADPAFAASGRFGSWAEAIEVVLEAARRRHDPGVEAWALHQRGTWAASLVAGEAGLADLEAARELRERIGDRAGEAATRHNIEVVRGFAAGGGGGGLGPVFYTLLALALAGLIFVGILVAQSVTGDDAGTTTGPTVDGRTSTRATTSNPESTTEAGPVEVPDVRGLLRAAAERTLDAVGLTARFDDEAVYSNKYDEEEVAKQRPKASTQASPGEEVVLTLSLGPPPDVFVERAVLTLGCADLADPCATVSFRVGAVGGDAVSKPVDVVIGITDGLTAPTVLGSELTTIETLGEGTSEQVEEVQLSASCPDSGCRAEVRLNPTFKDPNTENNIATYPASDR